VFIFILCFLALPAFLSTVGPRSMQLKQGMVGSEKQDKDQDQAPWEQEMDDNNQYDPPADQPNVPQDIDMYRDENEATPGQD